ncbi:hypothetical protein RHECNPAF_1330089 [Rhizobium etli CNPAF512]|nr:hypothetical protein RHECNPAF_1330089 [Rhizobium etli CNPAF512]
MPPCRCAVFGIYVELGVVPDVRQLSTIVVDNRFLAAAIATSPMARFALTAILIRSPVPNQGHFKIAWIGSSSNAPLQHSAPPRPKSISRVTSHASLLCVDLNASRAHRREEAWKMN